MSHLKWLLLTLALLSFSVAAETKIQIDKTTFTLFLFESDLVLQSQRAIIGKRSRPTPSMVDEITHVVINPKWNIPKKIARLDIVPKIQNDPSVIERFGYRFYETSKRIKEVDPSTIDWSLFNRTTPFPFAITQDPGPLNALGQIKFIMRNSRAILIHGTPWINLFDREVRAFSSGCVRIEDPINLAQHLLPNHNVRGIVEEHRGEIWIRLDNPITVEIQ